MKKWIITIKELLVLKDDRKVEHVYWNTNYANNWEIAQQAARIGIENSDLSLAFRQKVHKIRKPGEIITSDLVVKNGDGFKIQILAYSMDFFNNFKVGKKQIQLHRILRIRPYINYLYCKTDVWTSLILKQNERRKIRIAFEKRLQSPKK